MGKKLERKEPARVDQVYILGLDANGKSRGARFPELKDSIASAAMDMNCRVLIDQPEAVSALGMKLPVGRVHGGGKVVKLHGVDRKDMMQAILSAMNQEIRKWRRFPASVKAQCRTMPLCSSDLGFVSKAGLPAFHVLSFDF